MVYRGGGGVLCLGKPESTNSGATRPVPFVKHGRTIMSGHCLRTPEGGGGLGWVGSRLAPKVVTHGQCARNSPARLGTPLWLSGLTAVQTADDPRTPPRRWWEGDVAVPVCPCALGLLGGGGIQGRGTPLSFSSGPWLACVGGCVCPVLRAPAAGHGCPTTWPLRESVGRVTGSFLQPTTEPQRGARGVWSEVLLD